MARLRGHSLRGEHVPGRCAGRPLENHHLHRCAPADRHDRPFVYDGAINGNVFRAYVDLVLVPTRATGDVVIMKTCPPIRPLVSVTPSKREARACSTCVPTAPTSIPSKTPSQAMMRAKAERTITAHWKAVNSIVDFFTPTDCANYSTAAGYDPD